MVYIQNGIKWYIYKMVYRDKIAVQASTVEQLASGPIFLGDTVNIYIMN